RGRRRAGPRRPRPPPLKRIFQGTLMPIPRLRPRPLAVALAASLAALAPSLASAQSLIQLYDAAHAYDANYLSARAQYESAPYRVDQTRALLRPNVGLAANAGE